jgi:putative transposase
MINMTFEYKLEPTADQVAEMTQWLEICRGVYNYALAERRDWIKSRKCDINACSIQQEYIMPADAPKVTYANQCKSITRAKKSLPHLREVHSQVLQQVLQQLEKAFISMWEQDHGFPRFKKLGRMRSFLFPQFSESPIEREGLNLPKLGWIKIRLHRPIPDGFAVKQVRVVRRASGWYAMLALQCDVNVPDVSPHGHPIGIDVGLDAFVATSDGELIDRPRFFVDAQHQLKLLNRDVSRKQKGSKNQQKARHKVAQFYEKIANSRKDFHFKLAHHLCATSGMIFAEELNLKAMAKGMLGKHCLDAGWGGFLAILGWVAWKRGVYFAKVDAKGTSQYCPACDAHVPKDLSIRVHECPECKYRTNRDVASSQLVLKRGLAAVGQIVKKSVEEAENTKAPVKQKTQSVKKGSPRRHR